MRGCGSLGIGVFRANFGGDIGFLYFIVILVEGSLQVWNLQRFASIVEVRQ